MINYLSKIVFILTLFLRIEFLYSQIENVPTTNPVYHYLKRMALKGIIDHYHDAVLPLSRKQIAEYLIKINEDKTKLTKIEQDILSDLYVEFEYEIKNTNQNSFILFGAGDDIVSGLIRGTFHDREKILYRHKDENLVVYAHGLMNIDARRFTGLNLHDNAYFLEGGFRIRGSLYNKFGFYMQLTNAQFWGNRNILMMDKRIKQSYALYVLDSKNFDFVEGYAKYNSGLISIQLGRERILWGNSYGDKLYISDYARVFDFIKCDIQYKFFKYTFIHGWLNGTKGSIYLPQSNSYEPTVSDKYIAAHRLDFYMFKHIKFGIQEFSIYSNRAVDLGYLNPVTFFESVQRSRGERDNGFLGFDLQIRPFKNFELHADIFFDDIEIPKWGQNKWDNKYALQFGFMSVDPLGIKNVDFVAEYTRVDPFVFSHSRSRDNQFSSDKILLGTQIGPNAESYFFKLNTLLTHRLNFSVTYEYQRSGENIYDSSGTLIKNVGGDFLQPLRFGIDPFPLKFLDGNILKTNIIQFIASYEFLNEIFLDFRYKKYYSAFEDLSGKSDSHDFGVALRIDF